MNKEKINAPCITAKKLWEMSPGDFNLWRRKNDYPRIIAFLKEDIVCFTEWMREQNVTDEELLEFAPAVFLKESEKLMIYELRCNNGSVVREIRDSLHSVGDIVFHEKEVLKIKYVVPYFEWAKSNKQCIESRVHAEFSMNSREGRKSYLFRKLELIDAGCVHLPIHFRLGGRELEFLNLDDLTINNAFSNTYIRLWYSSAINLTVIGDLAFLDAYKTPFTAVEATRTRSMKLTDGNYQDWKLIDCELSFRAANSTLHLWKVEGSNFHCTLEHSDIKDCNFKEGQVNFGQEYKQAAIFHRGIKRLYSQVGDLAKAGEHFYKEKQFEQSSLIRPKFHFRTEIHKEKRILLKWMIYLKSYAKFTLLAFQNLLWGFGERPSKVFLWAIFIIIGSAILYNYHPDSSTLNDKINSFYFSVVTFSTLGYGEITQETPFLKIYAAVEALLGLSLMALVVAGFASKTKDYS